MLISKICLNDVFFRNKNSNSVSEKNVKFASGSYPCKLINSPSSDVFVKSSDSISFTSKKRGPEGDTSEGQILKSFDGIRGAYSGIPVISGKTLDVLNNKILVAKSPQKMLEIIKPYRKCLQPVQGKIYDFLEDYIAKNPNATLNEALSSRLQTSVRRVGEKERQIIRVIKNNLYTIENEKDRIILEKDLLKGMRKTYSYNEIKTKNGKRIITGTNFRRQQLINSLKGVKKNYCDENEDFYNKIDEIVFTNLEKLYDSLPQSKFDEDAFIVKYGQHNTKDKEIATSIIVPSQLTIEHIKPLAHGGKNDIRNFMVATDAINSHRGDENLASFVRKHPEVKEYCQWYTDDIIKLIKDGKMPGYEWYPYALKDTLLQESKGQIDIDISALSLTKKEVADGVAKYEAERPARMRELIKNKYPGYTTELY